jgi:hypothetical protein
VFLGVVFYLFSFWGIGWGMLILCKGPCINATTRLKGPGRLCSSNCVHCIHFVFYASYFVNILIC